MAIYDAMHGRKDIRPITVRHEQTAVYMADGYARVKGKPGVALVVPGPGVQNASAALGTAYACSSPVLLLAGQVETFNVGKDKGSLHEIHDQLDVVRPVTKWCHRVMEREKIPAAIHEAMRQMAVGRPRPVYVEIPWDTVAGKSEVEFPGRESFPRLKPNREEVKRAAELLDIRQEAAHLGGRGSHFGRGRRGIDGTGRETRRPRRDDGRGQRGDPGELIPSPWGAPIMVSGR